MVEISLEAELQALRERPTMIPCELYIQQGSLLLKARKWRKPARRAASEMMALRKLKLKDSSTLLGPRNSPISYVTKNSD